MFNTKLINKIVIWNVQENKMELEIPLKYDPMNTMSMSEMAHHQNDLKILESSDASI